MDANETMDETAEVTLDAPEVATVDTPLGGLLVMLRRLDALLVRAVAVADESYGSEAASDSFRGLHITQDEVERLLSREPGKPVLYSDQDQVVTPTELAEDIAKLAWLAQSFDLSPFELDVVLIALAPEIDLRYERIYAYLQDNVSRRRPTIDLVFNLLCSSVEEKLARRAHFAPNAPLIKHHLIRLLPDLHQLEPPLLSHFLKLDEQISDVLLGQGDLDRRLAGFCEIIELSALQDNVLLDDNLPYGLPDLFIQARELREPLRLYFHGPHGVGKRRAAKVLTNLVGGRLIVADLARLPVAQLELEESVRILFREAWLQDAVLYLGNMDTLRSGEREMACETLMYALARATGVVILAGTQRWIPVAQTVVGVMPIPFSMPDVAQRRKRWQANLATADITLADHELDALAGRFRLTPTQIDESFVEAYNRARWRLAVGGSDEQSDQLVHDLFAAARAQTGHELLALARKIEPSYTWDSIVLPDDALAQLREICGRVTQRQQVLDAWGFERTLSYGKGVNALFTGPSGTGKTMAAEIVAGELGLDLYKIDLSGVVSKYIGETEKNLDRVFRAAENANAILFFDEADALFGKRSEVRDSHDRYANLEISYLLQKMEEYEGLAILATNLRHNLDEAFIRRLAFMIHFPAPDESSRREIWTKIWPPETPLADDVDLAFLARQFKLSGGNIKNIALAAAFLAVDDGGVVTMAHLRHATRREYQKLGKALSEAELGGEER